MTQMAAVDSLEHVEELRGLLASRECDTFSTAESNAILAAIAALSSPPGVQAAQVSGAEMFGKEESRLRKVVRECFGPGWLISDCEAGANAIATLRTALASQIDITNRERELSRRLAHPGSAAHGGEVPNAK